MCVSVIQNKSTRVRDTYSDCIIMLVRCNQCSNREQPLTTDVGSSDGIGIGWWFFFSITRL